MIQSALLSVNIPLPSIPFHFNTITDAKASLTLLHVISDKKGFPNQDFNYTQPRHAALAHTLLANRAAVWEMYWIGLFIVSKCVTLWTTVCWQMKLPICRNWQQRTFWKEVCQSCLIQQLTIRGWLFHHNHPINFSSTCHTFWHARSMRIWTESIKVRCAVRQRWITKREVEDWGRVGES